MLVPMLLRAVRQRGCGWGLKKASCTTGAHVASRCCGVMRHVGHAVAAPTHTMARHCAHRVPAQTRQRAPVTRAPSPRAPRGPRLCLHTHQGELVLDLLLCVPLNRVCVSEPWHGVLWTRPQVLTPTNNKVARWWFGVVFVFERGCAPCVKPLTPTQHACVAPSTRDGGCGTWCGGW